MAKANETITENTLQEFGVHGDGHLGDLVLELEAFTGMELLCTFGCGPGVAIRPASPVTRFFTSID